jgi:hypothetical protein
MQVAGNYTLNVRFGGTDVTIVPQMIKELTITQDIDRILPTFRMNLEDATKALMEVVPYDKNTNKVEIELSRTSDLTEMNVFKFDVKRRSAASPEDNYSIEGILDVDEMLTSHDRSKYFTGNMKTNIESIASNLGIKTTEVGGSLSFDKDFLQPYWTDAKLLRYLRRELLGRAGEAGYCCFVKVVRGETILVFKSLDELLVEVPKYNLIVSHQPYEDYYPVSQYQIFDNSQLFADLGAKQQSYDYFDYATGQFIETNVQITDCPTLSEFLLLDGDRANDSILYTGVGRTNSFNTTFEGRVRNDFYKRANNFVHMWASTWGLENVAPGDVIQVVFAEAFQKGNFFVYQHSGLWLVKRVVHVVGDTFLTNLLLTRAGIDTEIDTTLLESLNRKR